MQRRLDLQGRKKELETYFEAVDKANNLPHSSNATALWQEHTEFGNYASGGGYYDQTAQWREDMAYVSAVVEYARLDDEITEADEALADLRKPERV